MEYQFEHVVAETLVQRAGRARDRECLGMIGWISEKVWAARGGTQTDEFVEEWRSRHADAIRTQMKELLQQREATTEKRGIEYCLKQLGSALAALDSERSVR